jgi:hypothetical protein
MTVLSKKPQIIVAFEIGADYIPMSLGIIFGGIASAT